MAQNGTARTETNRFVTNVSGDKLIEGDRIDKRLVARTPEQYGEPLNRTTPDQADYPETQLVTVTAINRMDDAHCALLVDPDTRTFVVATRHDSQSAWTQQEADWTVRKVGSEMAVTDGDVQDRPEDEQDQTETEYMATWLDVLAGDWKRGNFDYQESRKMTSTNTIKLNDHDGRKGFATIKLE
jgi:hypothetical protein